MIPVLGIPVVSHPEALAACVASIDEPVGRLVIIDNSPEGGMGDVAEAVLPSCVEELWVTEPPANLGYTASVNFIIRTHPKAPWWCVVNADTVFAPGDLGRLAAEPGEWVGIVDWRAFKLTSEAVALVGLWDESYFNYCSDADYEHRADLAGIDRHFIDGASTHVNSIALGVPRYAAHNRRSYAIEVAYHQRKWGGGPRGEVFQTPFDAGGDLRDWRLDIARLADEIWD
jgi:GT2 family glycosyltransferase